MPVLIFPDCDDSVKGVKYEGTPAGKLEKIGGVDCYVGTPEGDYAKDKVVLLLPDVFSIQLISNQLLVDDFAKNGFKTIAPDYLNGDPAPPDVLNPGNDFDIKKWFRRGHGQTSTRTPLDQVINTLKEQGVTKFAATGYSFGGCYVFNLAFENVIQVSAVAHPSMLLEQDLRVSPIIGVYESGISAMAPLLINSCTDDWQFDPTKQMQADIIFIEEKFAPGYKREHFDGCTHGFAVRGDLSDPKVKAGKEGALAATVKWFQAHL